MKYLPWIQVAKMSPGDAQQEFQEAGRRIQEACNNQHCPSNLLHKHHDQPVRLLCPSVQAMHMAYNCARFCTSNSTACCVIRSMKACYMKPTTKPCYFIPSEGCSMNFLQRQHQSGCSGKQSSRCHPILPAKASIISQAAACPRP